MSCASSGGRSSRRYSFSSGMRGGKVIARVLNDALAHFEGQVEAGKRGIFLLKGLNDAQGMQIVAEGVVVLPHQPVEFGLPGVAARRVPHVMHQRQRLHQVGVQTQRLRHGAADLRHFQRVRQAIAEVIGISPGENLGLVLQAAESAGVENAVAIAFVVVAVGVRRLRVAPALRLFHPHGVGCELAAICAAHSSCGQSPCKRI